jgi:hypothetical protein
LKEHFFNKTPNLSCKDKINQNATSCHGKVDNKTIEVTHINIRDQHVDVQTKPFGKVFFEPTNGKWE